MQVQEMYRDSDCVNVLAKAFSEDVIEDLTGEINEQEDILNKIASVVLFLSFHPTVIVDARNMEFKKLTLIGPAAMPVQGTLTLEKTEQMFRGVIQAHLEQVCQTVQKTHTQTEFKIFGCFSISDERQNVTDGYRFKWQAHLSSFDPNNMEHRKIEFRRLQDDDFQIIDRIRAIKVDFA